MSAGVESYPASRTTGKRASFDEMESRYTQLIAIIKDIRPATVRQTFYQMVVRHAFEKSERGYEKIQMALVKLRLDGRIPFSAIVDNMRSESRPQTFPSPSDAVHHAAKYYRKDLWCDADVYLQFWLEKDSLASVIEPVTWKYDVGLWPARGYSSITFLQNAAEEIEARELPAFVYHLGDSDPSGENAAQSIEASLQKFAPDAAITFERLAVLPEQIQKWNLPGRPTKQSDSRARAFGDRPSVELDSVNPATLRGLVEAAIQRHMPRERFDELMAEQAAERLQMTQWAGKMSNGKRGAR